MGLGAEETKFENPDRVTRQKTEEEDVVSNDPGDTFTFPSIVEIKRAIPPRCFQPNLSTSLYYVVKDLVIVSAIYLTFLLAEAYAPTPLFNFVILPAYWLLQGTMGAAIFCLGHDCGHGSFSTSSAVNDVCGTLLHTLIMVPYYPWKLSHRKHHKNTANIDRDEIFYPVRESDRKTADHPLVPLFGFGLGWFFYVVKGYSPRTANHLNPLDPLFARHALSCAASLASIAAWIALVVVPFAARYGLATLATHYLAPIFVFASWLVLITFLHHQDEGLPWYADHKWSFVKGNLSSVDRHYGWAHDLIHNIGTHQIHHLFSKIPHYHLEEATAAFRKEFPQLVRISDDAILPAYCRLFFIFNSQQWIKDDAETHVFTKNKKV